MVIRGTFARVFGRRERSASQPTPTIIVGIGNPGREYEGTRHNVGFQCVDRIAEAHEFGSARRHRLAHTAEGEIRGHRVVLAKPSTYVNESGRAVTSLLTRYRARAENVIVVYDDMALPSGKVRIRARGSHGGHNGMKSIIAALGAQEFARVRIGIGRPEGRAGDVEHVLGRPTQQERTAIDAGIARAVQAVEAALEMGVERAMNAYN